LIPKFGGHAMAAGLSLARSDFERFRDAFNRAVAEALEHRAPEPVLDSDGELGAGELCLSLAEMLREAGPFGQHFEEPMFDGEFDVVQQRIVGERHLKLRLAIDGHEVDAIAFNVDPIEWSQSVDRVGALFKLDVNEYRGRRSPQLNVQSLWPI
jgi:single-stranded-DNA-specific exonuclease